MLLRLLSSTAFLLTTALLATSPAPVSKTSAEETENRKLFDTVAQLDTKTFTAFNGHDVDGLMSMFTRDVEFYHDKGGLTNYDQTREGFTKMFGNMPDIRRDLVPGSLKVFPIKDFGAIEIGTHRFCHKENGENGRPPLTDCGEFPFVMIWQNQGGTWRISRVISYGH